MMSCEWFLKLIFGFLVRTFINHRDICSVLGCDIMNNSWLNNTESCYYFSHGTMRNHQEALDYCSRCGAHLAIDDNDDTHLFLKNEIKSLGDYWIGITKVLQYQWEDKSAPTIPNMGQIQGNRNDGSCVVFDQGNWRYNSCNGNMKFICKKHLGDDTACGASPPWTQVDESCYFYNPAVSGGYTHAASYCQVKEAYITTILDSQEQSILNNITDTFWIGMTELVWPNDETLNWHQWNSNPNIGLHDCYVMHEKTWSSHSCTLEEQFICERSSGDKGCTTSSTDTTETDPTVSTELTTKSTESTTILTTILTSTTMTTTNSAYSTIASQPLAPTTDEDKDLTSVKEEIVEAYTNIYRSQEATTMNSSHHSTTAITSNSDTREQTQDKADPVLIGGVLGAAVVLIIILVIIIVLCNRRNRKSERPNGDYDASYEIAFSPNTEDKTRNSDSSLTDDEKLAQLRNRDSRVVIDSNVPDSEKIKPYLVTTIVDGHGEGQPSRRSKVVSSIEDRVEYDNNNLDELIVTDNDLYHSSGSDPNRSDGRPRSTDYDYAVRPPHPNQQSQANVFINNAYDGEAEGGAGNHNQGAQIQYADIAFSTETLNKENTYADIDDFAPSLAASDAKVPTTAGIDQRGNTPGIANNDSDSGNQAGEMKAIPVYAEVDANKMDRNKNEIIDERKDAHDAEEGVNELIVTDNDLYDFNN